MAPHTPASSLRGPCHTRSCSDSTCLWRLCPNQRASSPSPAGYTHPYPSHNSPSTLDSTHPGSPWKRSPDQTTVYSHTTTTTPPTAPAHSTPPTHPTEPNHQSASTSPTNNPETNTQPTNLCHRSVPKQGNNDQRSGPGETRRRRRKEKTTNHSTHDRSGDAHRSAQRATLHTPNNTTTRRTTAQRAHARGTAINQRQCSNFPYSIETSHKRSAD